MAKNKARTQTVVEVHFTTGSRYLGLTQTQAAKQLGISQPEVCRLMKGRFTGFSAERLIALLNALEMDVEIVVRPRPPKQVSHRGQVRVVGVAT